MGAEAEDAERRRGEHLEHRLVAHESLGVYGELHAVRDRFAQSIHAVVADAEPDLDPARAARELLAVVREVHLRTVALHVLQILGMDAERRGQAARVAHHEAAALEGDVQPLVRVHRHRVRELDPVQRTATPIGEHGEAAVRGVHVEPESFHLAERRQLGERVHCAGVRGAPVGDDHQRD